ncbi:MAG: hypothetical protein JSU00_15970 [Acidobacteria bacterium]|nr:hypothetical protein [Acidobacteriota bacterium]
MARKKTMSEKQLAANRANAKKSTGPKTPAGKARSRYNSLKHGCYADAVVLPTEDRKRYNALRHHIMSTVDISDPVQVELAETLCRNQWCSQRAIIYEADLLAEAITRYEPEIRRDCPEIAQDILEGAAYRRLLEESPSLQTVTTYWQRCQSAYLRAYKALEKRRLFLSMRKQDAKRGAAPDPISRFHISEPIPAAPPEALQAVDNRTLANIAKHPGAASSEPKADPQKP